MSSVSPDFHRKSFRIKYDDAKLLSKDPSLRLLYYGDLSGAVPFVWETCPGTPKHTSFPHNLNIPPLTPPPSYYTTNYSENYTKNKCSSGSKLLLHTLLRRMNRNYKKNSRSPSSSLCPLSKSSSSNSWFSDTGMAADLHKPRRFLSWVF